MDSVPFELIRPFPITRGDQSSFAEGINRLRRPDNAIVLVTHYQRILGYVAPDRVHVLAGGRIVKSGDRALALELEARGYDWIQEEAEALSR